MASSMAGFRCSSAVVGNRSLHLQCLPSSVLVSFSGRLSSNGDKDCPSSYQLCSTSLVTLVEKGSTFFSFQQKSWSNSHYLAWIICSSLNQSLWLASIPAESYGWRMGEKCKLWENKWKPPTSTIGSRLKRLVPEVMILEKRTQDTGGKNIKGGFAAEGKYHLWEKSKFKKGIYQVHFGRQGGGIMWQMLKWRYLLLKTLWGYV